jgi:hypothetical protein
MALETIAVTAPVFMEARTSADATKYRDPTKWMHKTKLCVYHIQGTCHLGSSCTYAHTVSDIQDAPNLYKTRLCAAFAEGICDDEDCTFAHGEEELRISPNFKNKLCKWFAQGKCRNGDECGFAHGGNELRNQIFEAASPFNNALPPPPGFSEAETTKGGDIAPPPGLEEKQQPFVIDLESSLLDVKAPPSLEQQVEGMSAAIAALTWKMDELRMKTQVTGMKDILGKLTAQCEELEQAVGDNAEDVMTSISGKTSLRTKLSSKATAFKPMFEVPSLNSQAQPFVPNCDNYEIEQYEYEYDSTEWFGEESESFCKTSSAALWLGDESTDVGGLSSDSGGFSSD